MGKGRGRGRAKGWRKEQLIVGVPYGVAELLIAHAAAIVDMRDKGMKNREIALVLGIFETTVTYAVRELMRQGLVERRKSGGGRREGTARKGKAHDRAHGRSGGDVSVDRLLHDVPTVDGPRAVASSSIVHSLTQADEAYEEQVEDERTTDYMEREYRTEPDPVEIEQGYRAYDELPQKKKYEIGSRHAREVYAHQTAMRRQLWRAADSGHVRHTSNMGRTRAGELGMQTTEGWGVYGELSHGSWMMADDPAELIDMQELTDAYGWVDITDWK